MFDSRVRPWIDPPLDKLAASLTRWQVSADGATLAGLAFGLAGAVAIALGEPLWGLLLFLLNRLADGVDGALARRNGLTDRGGFLDIVCDFAIYAAVPLAFAVADPVGNALAAAALLASFIASGTTFLAFAAIAARCGLTTSAQGAKSIYYLAGLAEGLETIAAFAAMCLWPAWFPAIAWGFAAVCTVSAMARAVAGWRALG